MMKKIFRILLVTLSIATVSILSNCASSRVAEKGDAELWGDNCSRCHNAPGANTYSPEKWQVVRQHMMIQMGMTKLEADRIINYLSTEN